MFKEPSSFFFKKKQTIISLLYFAICAAGSGRVHLLGGEGRKGVCSLNVCRSGDVTGTRLTQTGIERLGHEDLHASRPSSSLEGRACVDVAYGPHMSLIHHCLW